MPPQTAGSERETPRDSATEKELKINGKKIIAEIRVEKEKREKQKNAEIFIGKMIFIIFLFFIRFSQNIKISHLIYYSFYVDFFIFSVLLSLKSIWTRSEVDDEKEKYIISLHDIAQYLEKKEATATTAKKKL